MTEIGGAGRETIQLWREHPIAFVRSEFGIEPDAWQADVLEAFPRERNILMKACKGPGKTAVLAWCALNFLATRPHPRIGATSITKDNIDTALWPELAKWIARSPFCRSTFTWTHTRVEHKRHPATWWMQRRTWPKKADSQQQADALGGLHEDYAMWVLDEMGGYPQSLMATVEAVHASGIETKILGAGNPTHTTGPLYRACTVDRAHWHLVQITGDPDNPNRSPRIDIEHARRQIAQYGRDNPWVMVNILGEFPPHSINALLGAEEVRRAMERKIKPDIYNWAQKRLGVDVARFGDDRSVVFPRQGLMSFKPAVLRNMRTTDIAAVVAKAQRDWHAELTFVDDTGHWGHGVIDNLLTAGLPCMGINVAERALDRRYKNRRAEMWLAMADWVRAGGKLPNIDDLVGELTEPTYTFIGGQFVLEDKDLIKARIGRSPDLADGLAFTFSIVDMPGEMQERLRRSHVAEHDFDPWVVTQRWEDGGKAETEFDPFTGEEQ